MSQAQIEKLTIADICCGSGTFLISVFDYLSRKRLEFLLNCNTVDNSRIIKVDENTWELNLKEKQSIMCNNIFGVDINPYAIEVARFSLLLKLLEGENKETIALYLRNSKQKVLPNLQNNIKCGNSLIGNDYFIYNEAAINDNELLFELRPFDWEREFTFLKETGGFDVIVGNPPYVRIQNLVKFAAKEIAYYRDKQTPYSVNKKDNFDKYYLFIERALKLLNPRGILGYIVPHKFFVLKGGTKLRKSITQAVYLNKILHFGVLQVFPERSTYTAIIILDKLYQEYLQFRRVTSLRISELYNSDSLLTYKGTDFSENPWVFVSKVAMATFEKLYRVQHTALKNIASIPVGLQTSADKIFIIRTFREKDGVIYKK